MSLSGDKGVAQFKKSVKMGHPIEDIHSLLSRRMCHYIMIVAWSEAKLGSVKVINNEEEFIYKEIILQIALHI